MNLDLITKLAKLANNNPNENEANLAARKVCKLLAEGEFKFNQVNEPPLRGRSPVQPQYQSASNPRPSGWSPYEEFFKDRARGAWDQYKYPPKQEKTASEKLREDQERQRKKYKAQTEGSWSYTDKSRPITDDLFDMINKIMEERKRQGYSDNEYWINEERRQRAQTGPKYKKDGPFRPFDPGLAWDFDPLSGKRTRKNGERFLKCKKCGNSKLTKFVGLPELYECNTCQWTTYEAKSKK